VKVFPDTNVWLSGLFGGGLCARLLDALITGDCEIIVGEAVIDEFSRIARDKFRMPRDLVESTVAFLGGHTVVPHTDMAMAACPDPDDVPIIGAALAGDADLFVTGDKALLELGEIEGLPIVTPRAAFLKLRELE